MVGRDSLVGAIRGLRCRASADRRHRHGAGHGFHSQAEELRAATERSSALRKLLARHEQALSAQAQQSAACNASHSVESRLSRLLLRARDLCDSEGLPLTQEFLAQMIGVRRNAVSIVAHAFRQAGFVNDSRGQIEIRDIGGLRRTSCECAAVVRTQCERLLNATD